MITPYLFVMIISVWNSSSTQQIRLRNEEICERTKIAFLDKKKELPQGYVLNAFCVPIGG